MRGKQYAFRFTAEGELFRALRALCGAYVFGRYEHYRRAFTLTAEGWSGWALPAPAAPGRL
jgi:hypothetical protein